MTTYFTHGVVMKSVPALALLFYPIFVTPIMAAPQLTYPPTNYFQSDSPLNQQQKIQQAPRQAMPIPRVPYVPQTAYPANPYAQYPRYPQNLQQQLPYGYPSQGGGYSTQRAFPQAMPQQPAIKQQKPFREFSGYLGLITDLVPSSVIAQLPNGITHGVLFKGFSDNSPASNSDLKPFDVIFSYDQTKLNHPAQLIKLIRNDKPGRVAKFKVVRKGKILEIPVTIGSQKTPNPKDINGLEIKQFGDDKFRAIIHYLGPNGNKQLRSFQGTREDIFDEVLEAKDLPPAERQQLLYAMRPKNNKSGFGSFMPFGNNGSKDWKFMNPGKYFKW